MTNSNRFNPVNNNIDFIKLEHEMLAKWELDKTFSLLRKKNKGGAAAEAAITLLNIFKNER